MPGKAGRTFEHDPTEITGLRAWSGGDQAALGKLAEQVYGELRVMARRYMKNERPDNTLQTTALVHEAFIRLVDTTKIEWHERAATLTLGGEDAAVIEMAEVAKK